MAYINIYKQNRDMYKQHRDIIYSIYIIPLAKCWHIVNK